MIRFSIDIIETRTKTVEVEANDLDEAYAIASDMYVNNEVDMGENIPEVEYECWDEEKLEGVNDEK